MGRTPDHWKTPSPRPNDLMARPGTESSNPLPSSEESAANPESLDQAVLISGGPQVKRRRVPAPSPDRPHVIASDDRAAAPKSGFETRLAPAKRFMAGPRSQNPCNKKVGLAPPYLE